METYYYSSYILQQILRTQAWKDGSRQYPRKGKDIKWGDIKKILNLLSLGGRAKERRKRKNVKTDTRSNL